MLFSKTKKTIIQNPVKKSYSLFSYPDDQLDIHVCIRSLYFSYILAATYFRLRFWERIVSEGTENENLKTLFVFRHHTCQHSATTDTHSYNCPTRGLDESLKHKSASEIFVLVELCQKLLHLFASLLQVLQKSNIWESLCVLFVQYWMGHATGPIMRLCVILVAEQ